MKPKLIFALLLIITASKVRSQNMVTTESVDSITVVSASVSNFKIMFQMSFEAWENTLINLGYGAKNIIMVNTTGKNISLFKTSNASGGVHSINKNASMISIDWYRPGGSVDIFKKLVAELQPYYVGLANGSPTYQIKEDGYTYQYSVVKYESGLTVMLKRF